MKGKHFFLILSLFCCVFFLVGRAETLLSGDGTPSSPYEISSAADFAQLKDMETLNKHFLLTGDISLAGYSSLPSFSGYLNGNGHTISGITAPLFSTLSKGQVSDLAIVNAKVSGGAIARTMTNSTVRSCLVEGRVNSGGLIAGEMDESSNIENVAAIGTVSGNTGLFAGQNRGLVSNSYFAGNATGTVSVGRTENSGYDQSYLGRPVSGLTAKTTDELMSGSLSGSWTTAPGAYPWPSALKGQPVACLALTLPSGDSAGRITQNFALPGLFAGQPVIWTYQGEKLSGSTNFAFSPEQTEQVSLTASVGGREKTFTLTLDRLITIAAETEDGRPYASGQKVNQRVQVKATGAAALEYARDGVTFMPYDGSDIWIEEKTELVFRYVGESAGKRFSVDISTALPVIGGVTDGHSGYLGKAPAFSGRGTLVKNGSTPVSVNSGTLIREPGDYVLTVTDEYGNTAQLIFTILAIPEPIELDELEKLRTELEDELLMAEGLPEAYLQEMDARLIAIKAKLDRLYAQEFDDKVLAASDDQTVESLYFAYQLLTGEQRSYLAQQERYRQLVEQLRSKRLTDAQTGILVVPLGEIPIDVYVRVEKTRNGYRVWLERNGKEYESQSGYTVKIPYRDGYLTYLAGMSGEYEDGYMVFRTDQLGEISFAPEKEGMAAAASTTGKQEEPSPLSLPNLGGWIVVAFIVGSMLLRVRKLDLH